MDEKNGLHNRSSHISGQWTAENRDIEKQNSDITRENRDIRNNNLDIDIIIKKKAVVCP